MDALIAPSPPVLSIHVYTDPEDQMKRSLYWTQFKPSELTSIFIGKKSLKADTQSGTGLLLRAALKLL